MDHRYQRCVVCYVKGFCRRATGRGNSINLEYVKVRADREPGVEVEIEPSSGQE